MQNNVIKFSDLEHRKLSVIHKEFRLGTLNHQLNIIAITYKSRLRLRIKYRLIAFSHRVVLTQKLVLTLKPKIKSGFTIQNYCVKIILKLILNWF